jgi:hypothetical protein
MTPARTRSMKAFASSFTAATLAPTPPAFVSAAPPSPTTSPPRRPALSNVSTTDDDLFLTGVATDGDEGSLEKDPMITRLGHMMALLGPRYKTIPKEVIWEKAQRGERTPAQRRLAKLGGIEAVGGGPDRQLRSSASAPGELTADEDGRARAAWLAARTAERERRNRAARSSSGAVR